MTEHEPTPPALRRGAPPAFVPSLADAALAVRRGRNRRMTRGLVAALAAVALPLAVVAATPFGGDDDSLRAADTPTAAPVEASPTPDAPPASPTADPLPQPEPQPTGSAPAQQASAQPAQTAQPGAPGPAGEPSPSPEPQPQPQPGPNSKTGVDDQARTLKVLVHAPGVGGGSAASGARKYWEARSVKGYRVLVEPFEGSRSACEQKAEEGFLIVGASGPEQTQACAGAPGVRNDVPYVAPGSVESGLRDSSSYVALSLTYRAQASRLVAMADNGGYLETRNGKGWALVLSDTPAATEAEPALVAALEGAGQEVTVLRVPRTGADAGTVANQLREGQYESVYFHGSPLFFIELTGRTGCPGYCPQWTGVGVSTNAVGVQACNVTGRQYRGEFLSPHPGLDLAGSKAPGVAFTDDVELSSYGSMQLLDQMLQEVPGPSFTRESFLDAVSGGSFPGGVYPRASFTSSRFGGTQAYALRMDCTKRQHVTTGLY